MKCPKCGYIGFEQTERCRNCGYDFALVRPAAPGGDLPLRSGVPGPMADLDLDAGRPSSPRGAQTPRRRDQADFDPRIAGPSPAAPRDLPLFGDDGRDEWPIIPAASTTPPLAVRRSTPQAARSRPRPTPRTAVEPAASSLPLSDDADGPPAPPAGVQPGPEAAEPRMGDRALAAVVDWLLLVLVDVVVVYFTLKICRLPAADVLVLPAAPLLAFFLLLNGGYLAMLTAAGGQTLGKMAFRLRVVGADERRLTVGRSIVRTAALILSALPAGLGLLPAVFSAGHRGVHDRLAGTRVVRVQTP